MAAQAAYAFVRNTRAGAIAAAWLVVLALVSTASAQVAQNSATVTAPSGINDLNAANNAATDSDPITIPLTLRKQWSSAFPGDDSVITVSRGATVIDTLNSDAGTANELDTDPTPVQVVRGETLTLNESVTGSGAYNQVLTCTGAADANPVRHQH